jgi:peptidoglycan L-alanyl-D-glutamate endopeptidase CwlK
MELDKRSLERLNGVHPDLVRVVKLAITKMQAPLLFIVTEGLRTRMRQAELVKAGASQTMNGRHLTGHAVDLAAQLSGEVRWDWPLYDKIAAAMKSAAAELNIPITWGGDWKTLKDGPHFELPRATYP